jgi:hypothetical protein
MGTNAPFGAYVKSRTDAYGATSIVGADGSAITHIPGISMGEIAVYGPDDFVGAVAQGTGQTVASATVNNSAVGTTLTWAELLFDTSDGAWSVDNPSRITIPAGVTKAWFTGSVYFPANGTGARWVRLTTGANSHMSNVLQPTSHAVASQSVQLSTGWIDVVAGDYYELHAIQDSGVSLVLSLGTLANKGGSNFFRAAFK